MIKPTPSRMIWYRPYGPDSPVHAAVVCGVNSDNNVNLCVFDLYGNPSAQSNVYLKQDDNEIPSVPYAEWMPYQKKVA